MASPQREPEGLWPPRFNNTRVRTVTDDEWGLICMGFYGRGLIRVLDQAGRIRDSTGQCLGFGFLDLGTGKLVEITADLEVLRSVFNLPPSNVIQWPILGDVATLPYQGRWQGFGDCAVEDKRILLSDDLLKLAALTLLLC